MRILVVEDERAVREMVAAALRGGGHVVASVGDGQRALELLHDDEEEFDLILSDYTMPRLNGLELLRQVKADSRTSVIPFVLTSGDVVVSDNNPKLLDEVATKLGAARFIKKPARTSFILEVVAELKR
ncbi:MAG: response regulator [bacterium]|nr:response regulator [bacterium]